MKLRRMKVLVAFQHYKVGEILDVTGVFGDYLEDKHYAEYLDEKEPQAKRRGRPRKVKEQNFVAVG